MINADTGVLEAPYNLSTLSQATGNPMLDLGYQCCDMRPYFEYKNGTETCYTTVHPSNLSIPVINVYEKYIKNVNGIEYDAMKYIGATTATSGTTITFNEVIYTYTDTIENIRCFYINKWAKYKPVRIPDVTVNQGYIILDQIPEEPGGDAQAPWRGNNDINWGFDLSKTGSDALGSTTLNSILTAAQKYKGQWFYQTPIPGQLDYFRMRDFEGYNPKAEAFWTFDYVSNMYTYAANASDISFNANIYKNTNAELSILDFGFIQGWENDYKFALIYGKTTTDPKYAISSTTIGSDSSLVSFTNALSGITDGSNTFIGCFAAIKGSPTDDGNNLVDGGFFLPNGYIEFQFDKLRIPVDISISPGNVSDTTFNFTVLYDLLSDGTYVPVLKFANNGNIVTYKAKARSGSSLNPPTTSLVYAAGNITFFVRGYNADGGIVKEGELPLILDETNTPVNSLNLVYENTNTADEPTELITTTELIDGSTPSGYYNLLNFFEAEDWARVTSMTVRFQIVNLSDNTNGTWILENDQEFSVTITEN